MHDKARFSMFCEEETGFYNMSRRFKEVIVRPLAVFLAEHGVKPTTLSYLGVLFTFPFVYFFSFNPWLAFIFMLINIGFDLLDGSVARYTKTASEKGALIDMTCDYLSFFVYFMTFVYYGLIDPFWSLVFIIAYLVLQSLISFSVLKKIRLFPIFRPKLILYLFFLIWLITGYNYMNEFMIVCAFYLLITDYFIYRKLLCSM